MLKLSELCGILTANEYLPNGDNAPMKKTTPPTRAEILTAIKKIVLVVIGTLALSFGCAIFTIPFDLVSGGVTGIAIVLNKIIPAEIMSIDIIIAILTWVLFFIGLIILGKDFALKTLISTIIYPVGITVFSILLDESVLGGFFRLQGSEYSQISLLLGAIFGGVFIGVGCALTFLGGGSTGGVDIIAFTICKFFKKWKSSVVIFFVDASIILLGMLVIGDFVITLLGIVSAFVAAIVIDRVFIGQSKAFTAEIVSEKYEEINRHIIEDINRTSTIMDARGGYSGEAKKLMLVTFSMRQYSDLLNVINKVDKKAFVSIHRAHEINGEGWTWENHESEK